MKIVVATDSFKGSLDAGTVSRAIRKGLLAADPGLDVVLKPMADGGEGTSSAMMTALAGVWIPARVTGPLPSMEIDAGYVWFEEQQEALIEMASACGLPLLRPEHYDPLRTTTWGVGELMALALAKKPQRLLLTVGGSSTVDGGVGALQALGWLFLDERGREVEPGGAHLIDIRTIRPPERTEYPPVLVLCDVRNPLLGARGAARVFGPQKGATPEMEESLEAGLQHLRDLVLETMGREMNIECGGAAGGMSAGTHVFLRAEAVPGIETVMVTCGLDEALLGADWVITGEGCFDEQSLMGKVVSGVKERAARHGVAVCVMAGQVGLSEEAYQAAGIKTARAIWEPAMSLEYAVEHAEVLLERAAEKFGRDSLIADGV